MKRAGGGFEAGYNAQTAVAVDDAAAHIIVAAELSNSASDAGELPPMLAAVQRNLGATPQQVLADTGYKSEAVFETLSNSDCDVVVALGREGKAQLEINRDKLPRTAAMGDKLQTAAARLAYARRKWLAEPPNGWIKKVQRFRQFSLRGLDSVKAEWKLVCLVLNLRRMATMNGA
jgi:hypothetical protein